MLILKIISLFKGMSRMTKLGEYFIEARNKQNISIDRVVEDTHIIKKFIIAIENDDFSAFPGEAYLKGFIRTYSDYLGLDTKEAIRRYEIVKMSETPTPMEQLIPKPSSNFGLIISVCVVVAVLIIGIGFFIFSNLSKDISTKTTVDKTKQAQTKPVKPVKPAKAANDTTSQKNLIKIIDDTNSLQIRKGDKIEIPTEFGTISFVILELDPVLKIIDNKEKEYFLIKGNPTKIDVNNDGNYDVEITVNSWDNKSADLTLKKLGGVSRNEEVDQVYGNLQGDNVEVLARKSLVEDISFELNILSDTFLRYKVDLEEPVEKWFKTGDKIEINAKTGAIVYLISSGAVTFDFKSLDKTYTAGDIGKVDVKLIKWVKNRTSEEFELQISSLK